MFLNLHGVQGQLPCVTASVRIELSREIFLWFDLRHRRDNRIIDRHS